MLRSRRLTCSKVDPVTKYPGLRGLSATSDSIGGTKRRRNLILIGLLAFAACEDGKSEVLIDAPWRPRDAAAYEALNIERVGHADLDIDSNLGLAVAGNYAYVGYKYDGAIDIVDISNPAAPARVGEFLPGFEAPELRAIADLARLYVLTDNSLVIFDLSDPVAPVRMGSLALPNTLMHELFLWRDPAAPSRVLAVISDVSTAGGFAVFDVSNPSAITVHHRQTFAPLHSVSVSDDGSRMYISFIRGEIGIMDSTQLMAQGVAQPATLLASRRVSDCAAQSFSCIAHATVKVPGRALAVVTYENTMCPKGWMDIVDLTDETMPMRTGFWRHPGYDLCGNAEPDLGAFGYGPHNQTVTANLALVSWYRAGFLVFDISDPAAPVEAGRFSPNVPSGSRMAWGRVASVSYPIIKDGLIYVVDGRNGLDILRYTGPHHAEVDSVDFLEGNSNL